MKTSRDTGCGESQNKTFLKEKTKFSASVKLGHEVFALDFQWIPDVIQWKNSSCVWAHPDALFWRGVVNSLKIAVFGSIGQLIVSSMAGYALAKIEFKGKNFMFVMILITMMIPAQAVIIPRYMLFDWIGLYGNHWALILQFWFNITSVFLLRQFYSGLPNDLMEAAASSAVVPVIVLFLFTQRYFVESIATSGVKG